MEILIQTNTERKWMDFSIERIIKISILKKKWQHTLVDLNSIPPSTISSILDHLPKI